MISLFTLALWALALLAPVLGAEVVPRATFTEVTNYGSNPTGTRMWLYVPRNLAAKPAVVVGIHWCSGSAQAYYQGSMWATNAEKYGYIVIYPQTPYTRDNCWDVASKMTLTHGGGGASNSIANMSIWTQQQWANVVKEMYPGYTGPRPKMQIYHGSADEALNVQNYYETIKQWTGVFGYSTTPVSETANYPRSPYTKYVFGDKLQTFLGAGVSHSIDVFWEEDLKWFGFVRTTGRDSDLGDADTGELLVGSDGDGDDTSRDHEPRIDDAGGQHDDDGQDNDDDDLGGRGIGDVAAVGAVRRHRLEGSDDGESMGS
ncbi:PHB depolymerase family esterase [Colletotrichum higginsianum]|nr:PHB depolymerase family esterase [Colletotrichum higginsianum]